MKASVAIRVHRAVCALATALATHLAPAADTPLTPDTKWLSPAVTYDGTVIGNLHGGLRRGSNYVGNLHLKLTATADAWAGPGSSGFADLLTLHGGRPSRFVGDAQGVSSIEGPTGTQIEELWFQKNFKGSGASVLVGLYDLNSEFYRSQAAGLFLNSALGIGTEFAQAGVEGPSIFPRTAAGVRLAIKPTPTTILRIALMDGVPLVRPGGSRALFKGGDGWLAVSEVAFLSRPADVQRSPTGTRDRIGRFSSLLPYGDKLAVGAWHFSGRFQEVTSSSSSAAPAQRRGTSGVYALGEHALWRDEADASKRLAAFAQAGVADPRTNRFASHFAAGLVGSGWGLINKTDQAGMAITHVSNGSRYTSSQSAQGIAVARAETTLEFSYLSQLSAHVTVQPDLQYVRRPNTDPSVTNAWVLQLHFELSF